jgi:exosortase A
MNSQAIPTAEARAPGAPGLALLVVLSAITLIFADTVWSMVTIWSRSETYVHGFLILPISIALIWQSRELADMQGARPAFAGALILAALSLVWWLSEALGVQVAAQLAVVAMVPAAVVAILGGEIAANYRFALGYLVFAVPFGEFLTPFLIEFTATATVALISAFGIPVFQDGSYFHIPTGSYEIARACAGLKYLIATLALTTLYSHFLFRSAAKAVLFVGACALVSVLANTVRATIVVLLLHYTDLDISAGRDHAFVGWIVYGLMIVAIVYFGLVFQDGSTPASERELVQPDPSGDRRSGQFYAAAFVSTLALLAGPVAGAFSADNLQSGIESATGQVRTELPFRYKRFRIESTSVPGAMPEIYSQLNAVGRY